MGCQNRQLYTVDGYGDPLSFGLSTSPPGTWLTPDGRFAGWPTSDTCIGTSSCATQAGYPSVATVEALCPGSNPHIDGVLVPVLDASCPTYGIRWVYICCSGSDSPAPYGPTTSPNVYGDEFFDCKFTRQIYREASTFTSYEVAAFWQCGQFKTCGAMVAGQGLNYVAGTNRCCPTCSAGECWCETENDCIECDEENADCADETDCHWDPDACEVTCDEPTCPPGESYDWLNCECSANGGGTRTTAGANPWLETHPFMSYVGLAFERSRRVRFKRTDANVLPFVADNYISADPGAGSYKDKQPCFEIVRDIGRLVVAFYREGGASPGIYLAYSDDDGETWTVEGTRTMQGSHPILRVHPVLGTQVLIAYRSGKLYGRIKDPGDADFGTEFTLTDDASADLTSDDDGVGLTPASDTAMRWYLTVRQSSTLTTFQSWDDCRTWTEVV